MMKLITTRKLPGKSPTLPSTNLNGQKQPHPTVLGWSHATLGIRCISHPHITLAIDRPAFAATLNAVMYSYYSPFSLATPSPHLKSICVSPSPGAKSIYVSPSPLGKQI